MLLFFETINIADFILVLNRSLENNKFLIYVEQWRDSTCQILNQWNSLTITLRWFKKVMNFAVFSSFLTANVTLSNFCYGKKQIDAIFYVSALLLMIKWRHNIVKVVAARGSTTLWQCCDVILSSIRGQTHKKLASICYILNEINWQYIYSCQYICL